MEVVFDILSHVQTYGFVESSQKGFCNDSIKSLYKETTNLE